MQGWFNHNGPRNTALRGATVRSPALPALQPRLQNHKIAGPDLRLENMPWALPSSSNWRYVASTIPWRRLVLVQALQGNRWSAILDCCCRQRQRSIGPIPAL